MKHIGIMTMHRVRNYGSFLQAYALKMLLEGQGHTVSFVDIKVNQTKKNNDGFIKKLHRIDRYLFKRLRFRTSRNKYHKMFEQAQTQYLNLSPEYTSCGGCDAVVIGSDEIFNCEHNGPFLITQERFGYVPNVSRVITYAASCGYTGVSDTTEEDLNVIAKGLNNLYAISVRDENTAAFVGAIGKTDVLFHLDPVLVYNFNQELSNTGDKPIPKQPFMIVYAYHSRIQDRKEISSICAYAKAHNLKTIAIGGMQPWCDEYVTPTPFEVLAWFRAADCIVTDTFHGTIISAKFHKRFAVIVRDSNSNKLNDLLQRLKLQGHKVQRPEEIPSILNATQDWAYFDHLISEETMRTKNYLQDALM